MRFKKPLIVGGAVAVAAMLTLTVTGIANAGSTTKASATVSNSVSLSGLVYGCEIPVKGTSVPLLDIHGAYKAGTKCGDGHQLVVFTAGTAPVATVVTVNASTAVSNRADSGHGGDWAKDAYQRTASITRQYAAPASTCGGSATECWFYTGTITDSGSFLTLSGANSPEAGTPINGLVSGTFTGGSSFEFYASSSTPNASSVPATLSGNGQSTSTWMEQFFPAGTSFAGENEPVWSWSYAAPKTCETWVDGSKGDKGDITGVNACNG